MRAIHTKNFGVQERYANKYTSELATDVVEFQVW